MLVEHFLEPDALVAIAKTRRNCHDFTREFSKPSPRVIGEFPKFKNLRRLALQSQSSSVSDLENTRLIELLNFIRDQNRVIREIDFDGNKPFQENLKAAEKYHFNGIHVLHDSSNDFGLKAKILSVQQFYEGLDPLPHQALMPKVRAEMCRVLGELLRLSKHITIVEPYFSTRPSMWLPFLELAKHAVTDSPTKEKTLHVLFDGSKNNTASCQYLKDFLCREMSQYLSKYTEIVFKDIRENGNEAIHNRYIITELGAVSLGYGLEETNANERDDVKMMDEDCYLDRKGVYLNFQGVKLVDEKVVACG